MDIRITRGQLYGRLRKYVSRRQAKQLAYKPQYQTRSIQRVFFWTNMLNNSTNLKELRLLQFFNLPLTAKQRVILDNNKQVYKLV